MILSIIYTTNIWFIISKPIIPITVYFSKPTSLSSSSKPTRIDCTILISLYSSNLDIRKQITGTACIVYYIITNI